MPPLKDLAGMEFGRLTVLSLHHMKRQAFWLCKCVCGNEKVIAGTKLTSGETQSCGCLHKELTALKSRKDLAGQVFGRLTVLGYHHTTEVAYWLCRCSCGNTAVVRGTSLRNSDTQSCGCYKIDATRISNSTHRLTSHPLHAIWSSMKQRCFDANLPDYKNWGGRGITVCRDWLHFMPFYEWAVANGYRKGLSLDRRDNDGNYEPTNCRFVTRQVQGNNTRRNLQVLYKGNIIPLNSLVHCSSQRYLKVWKRIYRRGWDIDRAIDTP